MDKYETFEQYESTLFVNVISTFLLALSILPKLEQSAKRFNIRPRMSFVSSETHAWAPSPERKASAEEVVLKAVSKPGADIGARYMDSKLVQILILQHIHGLLQARDRAVIWNILNPGLFRSETGRDTSGIIPILFEAVRTVLARTTERSGRPIASGLIAGQDMDGKYMHDGVVDDTALSSYVKSEAGAITGKRLWLELKDVLESVQPGLAGDV